MKMFNFENTKGVLGLFRESWSKESDARPAIKTIMGFFFFAAISLACGYQEIGFKSFVGYFAGVFFFLVGSWVHMTVQNDSSSLWPTQFRSLRAFRYGFFILENYPNIHPESPFLKIVRQFKKKTTKI